MSRERSEAIANEVWKLLMDNPVGMIGLCGQGGVGKTHVLKQIYNKLLISPHDFDIVIWVTVSQRFSAKKVQDDIWKRIGVIDSEWVEKSFDEKAKAIHYVLSGKRFMLFLDDVWKKLDLEKIGVPEAENESKILLTSRSEYECQRQGAQKIIRVQTLDIQSAFELFKEKIGKDKLKDGEFNELALLISLRCGGLPIFLCTVARAMACRTTYDEWFHALKEVTPPNLLNFCFHSLPNARVQCCFLFFSLLPEDFAILRTNLIDIWICARLLKNHDTETDSLELGYDTVDALIEACFLEEEENNHVKLQDMIREFGLSAAIEFKIFKRIHSKLIYAEDEASFEGVGWISTMARTISDYGNVPTDLLTFLRNHNPFVMIYGKIYGIMEFLTVLDLSNCGVEDVPRSIASIKFLRYLNLSHTWIAYLPVELNMLKHLEGLNLEHNEQLRVIPKQLIYGLSSLQILKTFRCGFSVEDLEDNIMSLRNMDIEPVICLKHLKVLSITITCVSALQRFFSNSKLVSCTQSLSLEVFWGTKSLSCSLSVAMKNLVTLEIHQAEDLKEFIINPGSLRERCFERLGEVRVAKCSSLCDLTWVILAPNLRVLSVTSCEEMKEIISNERLGEILNGATLEPFAKLEVLELKNLPELKSIHQKSLPLRCLKKMEVTDCSMLKKLPLNFGSTSKKDVVIEADEDWWNNVEWENYATKATFSKCFKPLQLD